MTERDVPGGWHGGHTEAELSEAFDLVKDAGNWKMPIDARLADGPDRDWQLISYAITFYTGSVPEIIPAGDGTVRVLAAGYYCSVGS